MNNKAIERAAKLAEQYDPKESVAEFARRMGVSYHVGYNALRTRPQIYHRTPCPKWTPEQDAALTALYGDLGWSITKISEKVGRSHAATKKRAEKLGLSRPQ